MFFCVTSDSHITFVCSRYRKRHTGRVIFGALCMGDFEAFGVLGTFIIPCSVYGNTGVIVANVMLKTIVIGDALVIGITGDDDTSSRGGAFKMLSFRQTIGSIFAFIFFIT